MGTFSRGLLGGFKGKVGSLVGSTWKGIEVLRSKAGGRKSNFSPEQLQQQAKFTLIIKFLRPLAPWLNQVYGATAVQMTGFNKATACNMLNGITGEYPDYRINYRMISLGQGYLPNAESPAAGSTMTGKVIVSWKDNSGDGRAGLADKAFVALYCEDMNRWILNPNAGIRGDGTFSLDAPLFSGKTVQAYLGFVSANGKQVSTSLYAGEAKVL